MKEKRKTLKEYFFHNFTVIFFSVGIVVAIMFFFLLKTYIGFSGKQISDHAENVISQYVNDMKTEFENSEKLWLDNSVYNGGNDMIIYMASTEYKNVSSSVESLYEMMKIHVSACKYLESVYFYSCKNDYVIASSNNISNSGYLNMFSDKDIIKKSISYASENIVSRKIGERDYISQCMPITIKNELIGTMIFNYNFDIFKTENYECNSGYLYVTLNNDTIFSTNCEKDAEVSELAEHEKIFKKKEISNFGENELNLWYFGYMEKNEFFNRLVIIVYFVIIGILFLMMALLSVYTTKKYYNSIIDIITKLMQDNTTFFDFEHKDIMTANSKTLTVEKNDSRFENIIAEKLLELRKYEAVALQSQLNSHFLFNTLNLLSILDLKVNKRSTEISKVVSNMSAILKYSMDLKNMLVTIEDEVAYCDTYVEIQKIKYKDKISFAKDIDSEVSETKIPKFILQPIVENAIFHGMDKKADTEQIKISAVRQDGTVCISVSNTGKTIEAQKLKALQEHIDNAEVKDGKHIGLSNINSRIKLLYGDSYGVRIKSENGITQVCVYIPLCF